MRIPEPVHLFRRILPLSGPFTCGELEGRGVLRYDAGAVTCVKCRWVLDIEQRVIDLQYARIYGADAVKAINIGDLDDATYYAKLAGRFGMRVLQ